SCLKEGAADYVIKDKIVRLPSAIRRALEFVRTEREKEDAELKLRQNEKQLKIITDVLPASLAYISMDFKFQFCNRINRDWFEDDLVGKHVSEALGLDVFTKIQDGLSNLQGGGQLSFEAELTTAKAPHFVTLSLVPDLDTTNQVKGF